MSHNRTERYLVLDLDNCTVTPNTSRADLLSKKLLAHIAAAQKNDKTRYAGFYICTHRRFELAIEGNYSSESVDQYEKQKKFQEKHQAKNLLISQIINNLSKETGLSCIAVSTPDDSGHNMPTAPLLRCGAGYNYIVKPFEDKLVETFSDDKNIKAKSEYYAKASKIDFLKEIKTDKVAGEAMLANYIWAQTKIEIQAQKNHPQPVDEKHFNPRTKNQQLLQIMCHADAHAKPKTTDVILDYFDDEEGENSLNLCSTALKIPRHQMPPKIRKLNVYHHSAHHVEKQDEAFKRLGKVSRETMFGKLWRTQFNTATVKMNSKESILAEFAKISESKHL